MTTDHIGNRAIGHVFAPMRFVFLSFLWVGASAIHAQTLPLLDTMPVSIVANKFVGAGDGKKYTLSGLTADRGFVVAGLTPLDMTLRNVVQPQRTLNESRFTLFVAAHDQARTSMLINLVATNRSCLVSTVDPVSRQADEAGRVIEISSTLLRMPPLLARTSTPVTLCTMDSGKLALYFSPPGFDMVQLTAISYGTPSKVLRAMASQSLMLYLPLSDS